VFEKKVIWRMFGPKKGNFIMRNFIFYAHHLVSRRGQDELAVQHTERFCCVNLMERWHMGDLSSRWERNINP
jgi:hypothetical protein